MVSEICMDGNIHVRISFAGPTDAVPNESCKCTPVGVVAAVVDTPLEKKSCVT